AAEPDEPDQPTEPEEPDRPAEPDAPARSDNLGEPLESDRNDSAAESPKTKDTCSPTLWFVLLAVSGCGTVAAKVSGRKLKKIR
ncbi:MAG: hypothetical protein ACI3XM_10835, partial [Eubacteriales bacterium]